MLDEIFGSDNEDSNNFRKRSGDDINPLPKKKAYSVSTSKGENLILYDDNANNVELDLEEEFSHLPITFSDTDLKCFHKYTTLKKKLNKLIEEEQLVRNLSPRQVRVKINLEEELIKLKESKLNKFDEYQLDALKREYKTNYLKFIKYERLQKIITRFQNRLKLLKQSEFKLIPYSPGGFPFHKGRKYLTMNQAGVVWLEAKTSRPMITFDTFDKSLCSNYWFNVDHVYDLASLNSHGIFLVDSGYYIGNNDDFEKDELGLNKLLRYVSIYYKSHDGKTQWDTTIELNQYEYVTTVSCGRGVASVFLSSGIVKKYNAVNGMIVGILKDFPVMACINNGEFECTISVQDKYEYKYLYSLMKLRGEEYTVRNELLNLSSTSGIRNMAKGKEISTLSVLRGFFFQNNNPCYIDNNEYLYRFDGDEFVPILNALEAFNRFNSLHNNLMYFPLCVSENSLQVAIIKDENLDKKYSLVEKEMTEDLHDLQTPLKDLEFKHQDLVSYNYPWFPLNGINNFKLEMPVTTYSNGIRNTKFNDPSKNVTIKPDQFQNIDDLFEEEPAEQNFNEIISEILYDSININTQSFSNNALKHDANLLKLFDKLVTEKKYKLGFNLTKSLKLHHSFDAVLKICNLRHVDGKFTQAVRHWRSKKLSNYRTLVA